MGLSRCLAVSDERSATTDPAADVVLRARALLARIRDSAPRIEDERRLPADLVSEIRAASLFRLFVPRALDGLELDPLTAFSVVEELSYADGSTGWCVMVAAQVSFLSC